MDGNGLYAVLCLSLNGLLTQFLRYAQSFILEGKRRLRYQLYVRGKIYRTPRSLRLPQLEQKSSFMGRHYLIHACLVQGVTVCLPHGLDDFIRYFFQWNNPVKQAEFGRSFGHAVNNTGCFVLAYDICAFLPQNL